MTRKTYPSGVSDEEWAFATPYLTLMTEDALQRDHPMSHRILELTGSRAKFSAKH